MPVFAFTVGSMGDIVSLLQIANTVIRALCDSKGSSAEYSDLILELDSVVFTVEGVRHELSIEGPNKLPAPVENGLHHAVRRCLDLLQQMDRKISAWRRGIWVDWTFGKDTWLKLGWCLFTREELVGLRRRLSEQIEAMNTFLMLAQIARLRQISCRQDELASKMRSMNASLDRSYPDRPDLRSPVDDCTPRSKLKWRDWAKPRPSRRPLIKSIDLPIPGLVDDYIHRTKPENRNSACNDDCLVQSSVPCPEPECRLQPSRRDRSSHRILRPFVLPMPSSTSSEKKDAMVSGPPGGVPIQGPDAGWAEDPYWDTAEEWEKQWAAEYKVREWR